MALLWIKMRTDIYSSSSNTFKPLMVTDGKAFALSNSTSKFITPTVMHSFMESRKDYIDEM